MKFKNKNKITNKSFHSPTTSRYMCLILASTNLNVSSPMVIHGQRFGSTLSLVVATADTCHRFSTCVSVTDESANRPNKRLSDTFTSNLRWSLAFS